MRKLRLGLIGFLFAFIGISNAQLSGGGDLNSDLKAPKKAQEEFMDRKIGQVKYGLEQQEIHLFLMVKNLQRSRMTKANNL